MSVLKDYHAPLGYRLKQVLLSTVLSLSLFEFSRNTQSWHFCIALTLKIRLI